MANKFHQGYYNVKNKEKYIGKKVPVYRSSWEYSFFMWCDQNPSILQWASESIAIPYYDSQTKKNKNYYPDVFIYYVDKDGIKRGELIEIKPQNQCPGTKTKSRVNQAAAIRNRDKWIAMEAFCGKNGITCRIITEKQMFGKI